MLTKFMTNLKQNCIFVYSMCYDLILWFLLLKLPKTTIPYERANLKYILFWEKKKMQISHWFDMPVSTVVLGLSM